MFNSNNTPFTMPVQPYYGGGNNGGFGGFGDDWAGLIIILALLGWGGNGFGGFGGFGGNRGCAEPCATQADVRAAVDQQTLISKLDQQTYGLADSTYALSNAINNGFFGVQSTLCQGFNGIDRAIADCCCTTQRAIDGVNYNMAKGFCDLGNTIHSTTRDIIDSQNAGTRAILDFLTTDKIATLQAENQNLKLKASQAEQNAYLLNELKPCPIPAYTVCNPFTGGYGFNTCGCA